MWESISSLFKGGVSISGEKESDGVPVEMWEMWRRYQSHRSHAWHVTLLLPADVTCVRAALSDVDPHLWPSARARCSHLRPSVREAEGEACTDWPRSSSVLSSFTSRWWYWEILLPVTWHKLNCIYSTLNLWVAHLHFSNSVVACIYFLIAEPGKQFQTFE